jgi:hypothetical protein
MFLIASLRLENERLKKELECLQNKVVELGIA